MATDIDIDAAFNELPPRRGGQKSMHNVPEDKRESIELLIEKYLDKPEHERPSKQSVADLATKIAGVRISRTTMNGWIVERE